MIFILQLTRIANNAGPAEFEYHKQTCSSWQIHTSGSISDTLAIAEHGQRDCQFPGTNLMYLVAQDLFSWQPG